MNLTKQNDTSDKRNRKLQASCNRSSNRSYCNRKPPRRISTTVALQGLIVASTMAPSINISLFITVCLQVITSLSAFQMHPTLLGRTFTTNHKRTITTRTSMSDGGNFFDEISEPSDSDNLDSNNMYNLDAPQSPTEAYAALSPEEFEEHVPKINCVTLVGRVGQNPEPKYFDDGKVVLRLGLAVKRKYHPPERQARSIKYGEEETDWFNLELWGRDAEYAGKYVVKGARVGVTGSLNVDAWTDRMSGEERTSAKIVVKQLDILETRAEAELRQNKSGSYNPDSYKSSNDGNDYGDGPSSGGTGGFFDDN